MRTETSFGAPASMARRAVRARRPIHIQSSTMLSPTLLFLIITNVIGAFQIFNSAFVASNAVSNGAAHPGDPGQSLLSTSTPAPSAPAWTWA